MANEEHVRIARQGAQAIAAWRAENPAVRMDLIEAKLADTDLSGANLRRANLLGANLREAKLSGADLRRAKLSEAGLRGVNLSGANLQEANLEKASLQGANLEKADLRWANLSEANLRGANLQRANLHGASLYRANLFKTIPHGADLSEANLRGADLQEANLSGANFSEADLAWANLRGADLSAANLSEVNLSGADLPWADLGEANLGGAMLGRTVFADADLSSAKGLGTVVHYGPSSIGVDTILKSGGKIPDEFLRGCGYDPRIQGLLLGDTRVLTDPAYETAGKAGPMKLQSCFISYSSENKEFADRLQKRLNDSGVDYWYAPEHGQWGEGLGEQIDKEITSRDRTILVCSKESLDKSDWVLHEIDTAIKEEKRRKAEGVEKWRVLFPVMIDDTLTKWDNHRKSRLLEVLAGDFRDATKGKAFEERFAKLLEGLKADGPN